MARLLESTIISGDQTLISPVFEAAELPVFFPHLLGVQKVMTDYVGRIRIDGVPAGQRFEDAVTRWADETQSLRLGYDQAKELNREITTQEQHQVDLWQSTFPGMDTSDPKDNLFRMGIILKMCVFLY